MASASSAPSPTRRTALTLKVITSSPGSLNTNFTLIMGAEKAVLVDAPFLRSDAYRLAADILESDKKLETIFVTHAHPDHFFGLDVLREAFPQARVIAAPAVVDAVWVSFPARYAYWAPQIGDLAPRYPFIPTAYAESSFELEGHRIEILGPAQGDDPASTALWVPELKALITGDIVFNQVFVYTGDTASRAGWVATLDRLLAMQPEVVVAGHTKEGMPNTRAALEYTRTYLLRFERAVAEAGSAEELARIMKREFPNALDFQGDFILTASSTSAIAEKLGQ